MLLDLLDLALDVGQAFSSYGQPLGPLGTVFLFSFPLLGDPRRLALQGLPSKSARGAGVTMAPPVSPATTVGARTGQIGQRYVLW